MFSPERSLGTGLASKLVTLSANSSLEVLNLVVLGARPTHPKKEKKNVLLLRKKNLVKNNN